MEIQLGVVVAETRQLWAGRRIDPAAGLRLGLHPPGGSRDDEVAAGRVGGQLGVDARDGVAVGTAHDLHGHTRVLLLEGRRQGVELVEPLARIDRDGAFFLGGGDQLGQGSLGLGSVCGGRRCGTASCGIGGCLGRFGRCGGRVRWRFGARGRRVCRRACGCGRARRIVVVITAAGRRDERQAAQRDRDQFAGPS